MMLTEIEKLLKSEIGDFLSGFGNPGEPITADEIVRELKKRIDIVSMAIFDLADIETVISEIKTSVESAEAISELEESISESNISAFGDGWYDGFLAAQKRDKDKYGCLEDIKEDEVRELSEYAESKHAELNAKTIDRKLRGC